MISMECKITLNIIPGESQQDRDIAAVNIAQEFIANYMETLDSTTCNKIDKYLHDNLQLKITTAELLDLAIENICARTSDHIHYSITFSDRIIIGANWKLDTLIRLLTFGTPGFNTYGKFPMDKAFRALAEQYSTGE